MAWGNVGVLETAATMTTATMAITKPVIYMEGRGRKKWMDTGSRQVGKRVDASIRICSHGISK